MAKIDYYKLYNEQIKNDTKFVQTLKFIMQMIHNSSNVDDTMELLTAIDILLNSEENILEDCEEV